MDSWYHESGFRTAFQEISENRASFRTAKERGHQGDQDARMEWDRGYEDCICAYRLGHDVADMIAQGIFEPSLLETFSVVQSLLDGTWDRPTRPDPRT